MQPPERGQVEHLGRARQLLVLVFLGVTGWYLVWRTGTFNPGALALSLAVFAAEAWFALSILMHLFMVWRLSSRHSPPPPNHRSVDVFITTRNEPLAMVRHTLVGAIAMDYPHQTWLLDDGNRRDMRLLAHALGCRYISRVHNTDAKAGNLNHALARTHGEFIAIFDADHVPDRSFLRRTLGYFRDPDVAFVQCPQTFYNLDAYQVRGGHSLRWGEQSLFFRVIQRGKDYWNATMFVGTSAVMRRAALEHIGGIATGTVTEDLHTTIRLQRAGWSSVYHDEALAFGLAAPSLRSYVGQRLRWGQGAMQVWRREGLLFRRGHTLAQRVCNLASVLTYFDAWPRLFLYALPGVVLITGIMPISTLDVAFAVHFVPYYFLQFWVFEELARGYGNSLYVEEYNLLRSFTFAFSTLALLRSRIPFRVTDKGLAGRGSEAALLLPQLLELGFVLVASGVGVWLWPSHRQLPLTAFIANLLWAALVLAIGVRAVSHTLRRARNRRDYRFPVPLPAALMINQQPATGVAHDISARGMCLRMARPPALAPGERVAGEVYLPGIRIPFVARVAHGGSSDSDRIGLETFWIADRIPGQLPDALARFLYSSDLQWRINAISERMRPPMEWLGDLLRGRRPVRVADPGHRWVPLLAEADPWADVLGLVSDAGDRQDLVVISFRELPQDRPIRLWRDTAARRELLVGRVAEVPEYRDLVRHGLRVLRLGFATPAGSREAPEPARLAPTRLSPETT
ncbi:MAG TPA: glycosyltransferase [Gammaproteobacteria bacterium]|nr:glycosyltransferase [Gammaproteobacteria bacterium]